MDQLNISEKVTDRGAILVVEGPVNSYTFTEFQTKVYAWSKKADLVLDMSAVTSLSSAGLGVLMAAIDDANDAGRKLWILKPSEIVRMAIESTGFADSFAMIGALREAF
ncbi:MAG: STAS domain-containing protein [Spirochaetales bacterium]|nr:STAS domain-containing protein [Spirochaetales bacterium]